MSTILERCRRRRLLGLWLVIVAPTAAVSTQGCSGPENEAESVPPRLRLVNDSLSPGLEAVALGPLWPKGDVEDAEEWIELQSEDDARIERAFGVWMTTSTTISDGCTAGESPPLLGSYYRRGQDLVFVPRFPFSPGRNFTACADLKSLSQRLEGPFPPNLERTPAGEFVYLAFVASFPSPKAPEGGETQPPQPFVSATWPRTDTVPANLLRFYVHFSQPMRRQGVSDHIALLSEDGSVIPDSFVEIPDGLWDPNATRLTLFLHPGRVKRGVGPRDRLGPVLTEGASFTLRIDGGLHSDEGVPLASPFVQTFKAGPADRSMPNPERWSVEAPRERDGALTLRFDEALDIEQLASFAWVSGGGFEPVPGLMAPAQDGESWSFVPSDPWRDQSYRIVTRRSIEDPAGNTTERLFDVDTGARPAAGNQVPEPGTKGSEENLVFPFEVRLKGR